MGILDRLFRSDKGKRDLVNKEEPLMKLFQSNPAAYSELRGFVEELITVYKLRGDFLPEGASGWRISRDIGQKIWDKYGMDGMQFVIAGVYYHLGQSASDSLNLAWSRIGTWLA